MWNDLYKTALLGTNRMTPSVSTLEKLREMGIETDDATEAVLLGVGMMGLARKAGFPLSDFEGVLPTVCPAETKSYMSLKAAQYVKDVFDKKLPVFAYLHPVFLNLVGRCVVERGKIVPVPFLLHFLDSRTHGTSSVLPMRDGTSSVLQSMLGQRGVWLASQNPKWKNVFLDTPKPIKKSAAETSAMALLSTLPLTPTPHLYNLVFDMMRKIGLVTDNAARIALFWCAFVEEMEKI
jgi:hypothetical protein